MESIPYLLPQQGRPGDGYPVGGLFRSTSDEPVSPPYVCKFCSLPRLRPVFSVALNQSELKRKDFSCQLYSETFVQLFARYHLSDEGRQELQEVWLLRL